MQNESNQKRTISLGGAISIGLGAMIGAGIFALVGISVDIAGPHAYFAFIIAGVLALLTAYNVAKLAAAIPSKGGKVAYINKAYNNSVLSGGLNVLITFGYAIVTSLYARAFAEYFLALLNQQGNQLILHLFTSGIVFLFLFINFLGARLVGKVSLVTALIQTSILIVFAVFGLIELDPSHFESTDKTSIQNILLVTGIIFMSYEGFGLVANTAEDIRNPQKNLPRALYISIIIVGIVYTLVTIAVIGNLDQQAIIDAKKYVLAEAAQPIFGSFGFTLMGIAALFSTASAINSTIYGPVYMTNETAKAGQLPSLLKKPLWNHKSGTALLSYGLAVLIISNTLNLSTIAETGSMVFLLIYTAINLGNYRLNKLTNSKHWISIVAALSTLFALGSLSYFLFIQRNDSLWVFIGLIVFSFVFVWIFTTIRQRANNQDTKG